MLFISSLLQFLSSLARLPRLSLSLSLSADPAAFTSTNINITLISTHTDSLIPNCQENDAKNVDELTKDVCSHLVHQKGHTS